MRVLVFYFGLLVALQAATSSEVQEQLPLENVPATLGSSVTVPITTTGHAVNDCLVQTPRKDEFIILRPLIASKNDNEDITVATTSMNSGCGVTIRNVKEEYLGDWVVSSDVFRSSDGAEYRIVQPFRIIDRDATPAEEVSKESSNSLPEEASSELPSPSSEEDDKKESSEEPIESVPEEESPESIPEEEVPESIPDEVAPEPESESESESPESEELQIQITTLATVTFETPLRRILNTRISKNLVHTVQSCHLRTPDGVDLALTPELEHPGLLVTPGNLMSSCIIELTVREEMDGEWLLYSKETNNRNELQEIRQPFVVNIEEPISTFPKDTLTIETDGSFYLRLDQQIEELESCDLVPPPGLTRTILNDDRYAHSCGFIVRNAQIIDSGTWQILAKGRIAYRATVDVVVQDSDNHGVIEKVTLTKGEPVQLELGPENALFCQVRDAQGSVVFSGFSACKVELEAARMHHAGWWSVSVGVPGRLLALEKTFAVSVEESVALNVVSQRVERDANRLRLSCNMTSERDARVCKFIRPDSTVLVASEGVGQGWYSYFGNGVRTLESGLHEMECGLQIDLVQAVDLGTWRCSFEAGELVSSAFLRVSQDTGFVGDADVGFLEVQAKSQVVEGVRGEEIVMSCSVSALLNYCWFRAQNGSVISVAPGVATEDYEYVGSGLDAGECGVRIHRASVQDTGTWTCNVGVDRRRDLSARINVTVHSSPLVVSHWYFRMNSNTLALVVDGRTYDGSALDYCRFVTPRGSGFQPNSEVLPPGYITESTEAQFGRCRVIVHSPGWEEQGTWMVAGRLTSGGQEIIGTTQPQHMWNQQGFSVIYTLIIVIIVCLNVLFLSVLINKKSRRWTSTRVSAVGTSIRNSFRKPRTAAAGAGANTAAVPSSTTVEDAPPTYDTVNGSQAGNQNVTLVNTDELQNQSHNSNRL